MMNFFFLNVVWVYLNHSLWGVVCAQYTPDCGNSFEEALNYVLFSHRISGHIEIRVEEKKVIAGMGTVGLWL